MARLPLTVYLPRADLARLEARARAVGLARSALAGNAIKALLDGKDVGDTALADQLRFLRLATEELIAVHPQSEAKAESSITSLGNKVTETIEASHRRWQQIAAKNLRDRYWLGGAALAGMAALGLMLELVSGTGIGRSVAVKLAGAENRWEAALLLAGDGSPLHAQLMSETRTLLKVPSFLEPYDACVERAKRAKASFNCKLKMPPLRGVI